MLDFRNYKLLPLGIHNLIVIEILKDSKIQNIYSFFWRLARWAVGKILKDKKVYPSTFPFLNS